MDTFTEFSMVGVYDKPNKGPKFVHVSSKHFMGKFTILLFMDNKLTELEIEEWKCFSDNLKEFKEVNASVVGVCTDSHITMRTQMMSNLRGIKFPVISDRDGDFSRTFGVLKLKDGKFGAARALVILDQQGKMVHLTLHNELAKSYPSKVLDLIKNLTRDEEEVVKTAVTDHENDEKGSTLVSAMNKKDNNASTSSKENAEAVSKRSVYDYSKNTTKADSDLSKDSPMAVSKRAVSDYSKENAKAVSNLSKGNTEAVSGNSKDSTDPKRSDIVKDYKNVSVSSKKTTPPKGTSTTSTKKSKHSCNSSNSNSKGSKGSSSTKSYKLDEADAEAIKKEDQTKAEM